MVCFVIVDNTMASDPQTRRLFFAGHSHCRRLADFVRLSPARVNFGFALNDIRVEFCAQGGAHVDDLVKPHSKGLLSSRLRNTLIYCHFGRMWFVY